MIRILLLTLSLLFTQELEVQGDLKVSGNIDAQNNPVKNVGTPQSLTDAINGNILQDALRDDGPFEYKMYMIRLNILSENANDMYYYEYIYGANANDSGGWETDFHNVLFPLLIDGWKIDQNVNLSAGGHFSPQSKQLIILKRPIEE